MTYTDYGLRISLEELEKMVEYAKNRAKYGNMESCVVIKGGDKPRITQYCCYHECNSINHTYGAKDERKVG